MRDKLDNNFLLSRIRKTFLDHSRLNSELYTAIEEYIDDPSPASLEVVASKIKGLDSTSDILKDTIRTVLKEISEQNDG